MAGDHRTRPPPGGDVDRGEGDRSGNPSSAPWTLIVCLHPVLQPEQPSRQPSEMPALITQLINPPQTCDSLNYTQFSDAGLTNQLIVELPLTTFC